MLLQASHAFKQLWKVGKGHLNLISAGQGHILSFLWQYSILSDF